MFFAHHRESHFPVYFAPHDEAVCDFPFLAPRFAGVSKLPVKLEFARAFQTFKPFTLRLELVRRRS